MSDTRSTRVLIGIVFLVAAGLLAVSNLVRRIVIEDWWLVGVLSLAGLLFVVWPESKSKPEAPNVLDTAPKTRLPVEPDSLKEQRSEIMEKPASAITTPPPTDIVVKSDAAIPTRPVVAAKPAPKAEPAAPAESAPGPAPKAEPDDLTRVEGIGPKYRDALVAAGIDTFAKVAEKSLDELQAIIKAAGMRKTASMETWAQQAALAAKGDWDALAKLQDELTGGRKS